MINNTIARRLLYAWNGGQRSSFYAAASSGLVADWSALKHECYQCYCLPANSAKDKAQLGRLLDWLVAQQGKCANRIVLAFGVRYNALPWGHWEELK